MTLHKILKITINSSYETAELKHFHYYFLKTEN